MNPTIRWSHGAAGLGVMLALSGSECRPWSPATRVERESPGPGLVQTVSIEPAEPRRGETIQIVSTVTNQGSRPIGNTFVACGLGFAGDLMLATVPGTARCLAVSYERKLDPGESVVFTDAMVVDSPPGLYRLEVGHMVPPAPRAGIDVRVIE